MLHSQPSFLKVGVREFFFGFVFPAARFFYVLIFYVHGYFAHLYVSAPNVFLVLLETRIGCEIPYKSYRQM